MAKPYSSRLIPLSEWVLVRKNSTESSIEIPVMGGPGGKSVIGSTKKRVESSRAVVVAVGPGEWRDGIGLVKPDAAIRPGVTVIADARHFLQVIDIPEMKEEGLWQIPASLITFVEEPAGVHKPTPAMA